MVEAETHLLQRLALKSVPVLRAALLQLAGEAVALLYPMLMAAAAMVLQRLALKAVLLLGAALLQLVGEAMALLLHPMLRQG